MSNSNRQQRTTMVVSTLIAAAILGAAVTAQHGHRQPRGELAELESDLRIQLQMAYRHDTTQYKTRIGQLDQVLNAWLQSSRSTADKQSLSQWLRQAIRNAMPGSTQPLPPPPVFDAPASHSPAHAQAAANPPKQAVSHNNKPRLLPRPAETVKNAPTHGKTPVAPSTLAAPKKPAATVPSASKSRPVPTHETSNRPPSRSSPPNPKGTAPPQPKPRTKVTRLTARSTSGSRSAARMTRSSQQAQATGKIAINLSELAARTTGYHDGLNEIEATLFLLDSADGLQGKHWQRLSSARRALGQLQQLVDDYLFIKLYHSLLSDKQRQQVTAPQSPALLCKRFSQCLDQWNAPRKGDYLQSFERKLPESQQTVLRELRSDMAEIVTRIGD